MGFDLYFKKIPPTAVQRKIVGGVRGEAGKPTGRLLIQEGGSRGGREVGKFKRYSEAGLTGLQDGLAWGEDSEGAGNRGSHPGSGSHNWVDNGATYNRAGRVQGGWGCPALVNCP